MCFWRTVGRIHLLDADSPVQRRYRSRWRPEQRHATARRSPAVGRLLGTVGTVRAQSQLRQAFVFTNTYVLLQPESWSAAREKFDADDRLVDHATRQALAAFLRGCADLIALHFLPAARITA